MIANDFDAWKVFWTFNTDRAADLGSLWLVWDQSGHPVSAEPDQPGVARSFFVAVCVAVLVLGLRVPPAAPDRRSWRS